MQAKADYTIVGIFVVVLSVCFVSFFFWLSAKKHDVKYQPYLIYTNEDVTGLDVQSPVRFSGVVVGFVSSISLDKRNPQFVKVKLQIVEDTPITTSTYATFNTQGITGLIYVGLKASKKNSPLLKAKPGQLYPVLAVKKSILSQITNVVPTIAASISKAAKSVQLLLSDKNRIELVESLKNMRKFTAMLASSSQDISDSIKKLNATLSQTAIASKQLPAAMEQLRVSLKQIDQTAQSIRQASSAVNQAATNSKRFVNNLNQQAMPKIQQSMSSFSRAMDNVSELTAELNRNPSQLVRGRAQPALGPGEK